SPAGRGAHETRPDTPAALERLELQYSEARPEALWSGRLDATEQAPRQVGGINVVARAHTSSKPPVSGRDTRAGRDAERAGVLLPGNPDLHAVLAEPGEVGPQLDDRSVAQARRHRDLETRSSARAQRVLGDRFRGIGCEPLGAQQASPPAARPEHPHPD